MIPYIAFFTSFEFYSQAPLGTRCGWAYSTTSSATAPTRPPASRSSPGRTGSQPRRQTADIFRYYHSYTHSWQIDTNFGQYYFQGLGRQREAVLREDAQQRRGHRRQGLRAAVCVPLPVRLRRRVHRFDTHTTKKISKKYTYMVGSMCTPRSTVEKV